MQPSDIKIRCSSLGYIMSDPREKAAREKGELSETCKGHLADIMVRIKYDRQTDIQTKYTIKGNLVEEDSITLYSRLTKRFYAKNEERISNEWIAGTPDLYEGDSIDKATIVHDMKSSWDIFTFFRNHEGKLNTQYYYQLMGYMALTGAKKAHLAYCLINTPLAMLYDEKRRLFYRMGVATEENPEYLEACDELEKNLTYDDIPLAERCIIMKIDRDEEVIQRIYKRVEACRAYMFKKYSSLFTPSVLLAHHDAETHSTIIQGI